MSSSWRSPSWIYSGVCWKKRNQVINQYIKKSKTLIAIKIINILFFVESFQLKLSFYTMGWRGSSWKKETTAAAFCTWIKEAFVNSFFDWIKGKIISRTSDKAHTLFEMTCPADIVKGALHIDVSVFKGFPLPAYAFCMLWAIEY